MELVHGSLNINKEKNQKATKKTENKTRFFSLRSLRYFERFFLKIENSFVFEVIKSSEALKASHKARTLCLQLPPEPLRFSFFFVLRKVANKKDFKNSKRFKEK